MFFYSASLSAVYGGTDGGANEEATSQFTLRAKCAKRKPTFADKLIIHQSLRHVTITSPPSSVFHLWWCRALSGMGVYSVYKDHLEHFTPHPLLSYLLYYISKLNFLLTQLFQLSHQQYSQYHTYLYLSVSHLDNYYQETLYCPPSTLKQYLSSYLYLS